MQNHSRRHQSGSNHFPGRRPRSPPTITLRPGQVLFRIICHNSIIGGVIGPSGSVISSIRRDTGCVIHCEDPIPGSEHRIIFVVGSGSVGRRVLLKPGEGEDDEEEEEVVEETVSGPQEAVLRVVERMWAVEARTDGGGGGGGRGVVSEGYCGLLADTSLIGAVVGRKGRNVMRMRRESGAEIRMLPAPPCAAKDDELIQIAGGVLAVKKALVAVTGCLQDCPPSGTDEMSSTSLPKKKEMSSTRHVERASYWDSFDPHAEFFPHLSSLLLTLTANTANAGKYSLSSELDVDSNQTPKSTQKTVSFRLLCSDGAAGSIIGKKGSIVRTLQNGTGASIIFSSPMANSSERVVTITATENVQSSHSPAQDAVVLVFARSIEHDIEKRHLSGLIKCGTVTARLLVEVGAVCCLSGNGDGIDSEMTETTGADIQILEGDPVLDYGFENDVVVQIAGEYSSVQNALFQVTYKLRDNLLPGDMLREMRARSPYEKERQITSPGSQQSASMSVDSSEGTVLTKQMDQPCLFDSKNKPPSPGLSSPKKLGKGLSTAMTGEISSTTTFDRSPGLERSLHFLLPREVLREVGLAQTVGEGSAIAMMDSEGSATPVGETAELDRMRSIIVANTTLELIVSEDILGSVFGEDGSKLARLSQISGAKMEVHDPSPGSNERIVTISGKPNQTREAESLLRASIIIGQ